MSYYIENVDDERLVASFQQPASRSAPSNALKALARSIKEDHLQYPPLVTRRPEDDKLTIIDGHRRVAAMRSLGWQMIPVLISGGDPSKLFAAVSGTTRRMSAVEWAEVYMNGGAIPGGPTMTCLNNLKATYDGMEFIKKLVAAKVSPQIWNVAERARKYMRMDERERIGILEWLLSTKGTRSVGVWITEGDKQEMLISAYRSNKAPTHMAAAA